MKNWVKQGSVFLVIALIVTLSLLFSQQAHASTVQSVSHQAMSATCSQTHCNGTNPYTTGCAGTGASYWVVDSVPLSYQGINHGWIQLWYSGTCGTNWARYACASSCEPVTLFLMVCKKDGSAYSVQGPIFLHSSGQTGQQYLPTTPAQATGSYPIVIHGQQGNVGAETGCY